jgi:hypothetical protein
VATMTVHDVLMKARVLLAEPSHWTQGAYARDASGRVVHPRSPAAVCWCIVGAVKRADVRTERSEEDDGLRVLLRLFHPSTGQLKDKLYAFWVMTDWNDDPSRTHADVLALLDEAIAEASDG